MKKQVSKIILSLFVVGLLTTSTSFFVPEVSAQEQVQNNDYRCRYDQCHATAKSTGRRCRHCVSNSGDYYCWQHK